VDAALATTAPAGREDQRRLLADLARVARHRVVVFAYDADQADALWLVRDYLPELGERARARTLPIDELVAALAAPELSVERVPVPHDCRDGILGAYWRRPERYLDPALREGDGPLAGIPPGALRRGLDELRNDLEGGAWRRRYGGLLRLDELDVGYRLVTAELE
jgi:hypothetical protein